MLILRYLSLRNEPISYTDCTGLAKKQLKDKGSCLDFLAFIQYSDTK